MGTDIHLAAEVRNDDGEWEYVPGPIIDCWACDGTGMKTTWEDRERVRSTTETCRWCCTKPEDEDDPFDRQYATRRYVGPGKTRDSWYSDRNYTVFAILGNVRNGEGFAGVYTHDPLPYISDWRGVPDDVTEATRAVLSNEHSETWCTLAEIMDYDWHAPIHRGGVVSLEQFEHCKRTGEPPNSWSGGISGQGIVTVSMTEADAILGGRLKIDGSVADIATGLMHDALTKVYVNYEWDDTLADSTQHFLDRMKMLAMQAGEHECRLVFDFDS